MGPRRATLYVLAMLLAIIASPGPSRPLGIVHAHDCDPLKDVGTAYFNDDDDYVDMLMRDENDGHLEVWFLHGYMGIEVMGIQPTVPSRVDDDLDWRVRGTGDFNGDGHADILWHHKITGQLLLWTMNKLEMTSSAVIETSEVIDPNWRVETIGDFNGDGKADLLWRHGTAGELWAWFMNGPQRIGTSLTTPKGAGDALWFPTATGDFNHDGRTDIVWRHPTAGQIVFWYMGGLDGATMISGTFTTPDALPIDWRLAATGDFDRDGNVDLIWQGPPAFPCVAPTGQNVVWFMRNATKTGEGRIPHPQFP